MLDTLTQNAAGVGGAGNPRFSHYTYTDISARFFVDSTSLFRDFPDDKDLLKPGGKLVLFKLTEPEVVCTNFAFGLLPGWWRFDDAYRDFSAGVPVDTWHTLLLRHKLSGVELGLKDYEDIF
ncbi:hypothetical protein BDV06DRAFT_227149 [Aspergillus oleicola]